MIVTKQKRDQLLMTLKKRARRLETERQAEEEGHPELKVIVTSICGCDFGDPCCPEDK